MSSPPYNSFLYHLLQWAKSCWLLKLIAGVIVFSLDLSCSSESRSLERQAIVACDEGRLDKALTLLGQAIQMAPNRPACYNNRAQVLRLKGLNAEARRDLDKAIEVSGGRGRSACQAYVQRGS